MAFANVVDDGIDLTSGCRTIANIWVRIAAGGSAGCGGGSSSRLTGKERIALIVRTGGDEVRCSVLKVQHRCGVQLEAALTDEDFLHPGTKDDRVGTAAETFKGKIFMGRGSDTATLGELHLVVELSHPVEEGLDGLETRLSGGHVLGQVSDRFGTQATQKYRLDPKVVHFNAFALGNECHAVYAIDVVLKETAGVPLMGGAEVFCHSLFHHGREIVW
jgi:hypothetical protein